PARTAGAVQRFGYWREGAELTTGRLDQQRSAATGRVGLDPVAHADAARAVFGVVSLSRTLSLLFALRHFFFGQPEPVTEVSRAVHRQAGDVVDRPGATQVGIAR